MLTQINAARPEDASDDTLCAPPLGGVRSVKWQAPTYNQTSWGSPYKAGAASAATVH